MDKQKIVEVENRAQYSIDGNTKTYEVPLLYDEKLLDYTEKDAFDVILMNPPYGGSEKEDIKQNFPADRRNLVLPGGHSKRPQALQQDKADGAKAL